MAKNLIFQLGLLITVTLFSVDGWRVRREGEDPEQRAWNSEIAEVTTPQEFIDEALKVHNDYRKLHHVPDLVLNNELCQISQAYANKLAENASEVYDNSDDAAEDELGENLYFYQTNNPERKPNATKIIAAWYDEVEDYDFLEGGAVNESKEILHFTQIVWKETTQMGIAYSRKTEPNEEGYYVSFIVANYDPRANWDNPLVNVFPIDLPTPPEFPTTTVSPVTSSELPIEIETSIPPSAALPETKENCKGIGSTFNPVVSIYIGFTIFLAYF